MLNDLAAGRRLARRVVWAQLGVALAVGLGLLPLGLGEAKAAAASAAIVALGTFLASRRVFARLAGAGLMMRRWLGGVLLRWLVVLVGEGLILIHYKWPPLAAIAGLTMACAVNLLAFRCKG